MHLNLRLIVASSLFITCFSVSTAFCQEEASEPRQVEQVASLDSDLVRSHTSLNSHDPGCPHHGHQAMGDPYGFTQVLNQYRAMAGLSPVVYDPNLSAWASQNNAVQCERGIGHHVNPNCFQNCGWNYQNVYSVAEGWMNSPGHRQNMMSPSITRFGIAYGPGPYWTMNAQ